jgi:hypothetical protein
MIKRLGKMRFLRTAGFAVGAVAIAGAAVIITASASGMTFGVKPASAQRPVASASASSAACTAFMKHFAVEIGKTQAQINTAFQKAIGETLADEVKSGQITQAQADAITKKLANQTPCNLQNAGRPHGGGNKPQIGGYMQQYIAASAAALGISESQLKTDLAGGQSLSQVAAAQHVSEADFRTKLIANLKPVLDKAVTDKKLTAEQETLILQRLQNGPLPLWTTAPKHQKPPTTTTPTAS